MKPVSRVDLHLHSTASDGMLTPEQVVELAAARGIGIIALTDHDTTRGVKAAQARGERLGVRVLSGLEISTVLEEEEVHILGYRLDIDNRRLQKQLALLSSAREERIKKIINKLNQLGYPLHWDEVSPETKTGNLGRPHVARAMVKRGYAASGEDAFHRFLSHGAPAFVPRYKIHPVNAVDLVHAAGGLAFLAHPGLLKQMEMMDKIIAAAGLDGLEAYHSQHPPALQQELLALANAQGLFVSGGSDCHGEPGNCLLGTVAVPWAQIAPWLKD